jgi:tRNA1(Val) A37 N6-methylase TrmN6
VGAGVGVVGLAVACRVADADVTLVERDPALAAYARANIERNGLGGRVRVIEADVARPLGEHAGLSAAAGRFDHVLANPPYHVEGRGTAAADRTKAAAHAMPEGGLDRWLRFMAAMARPGGTATLIHRADALGELLAACAGRFGGLAILPLQAGAGEPAGRILLQGIKGSRAPLALLPGLVLHGADGTVHPRVEAVLRAGAPLSITRV